MGKWDLRKGIILKVSVYIPCKIPLENSKYGSRVNYMDVFFF